jgi:hypothetical protein
VHAKVAQGRPFYPQMLHALAQFVSITTTVSVF